MAQSVREQIYAHADEQGGSPAAAVNVFVQKKLGCDRVSDQHQGSRSGSHQAQVEMIEREQQSKERQRKEEDTGEKQWTGDYRANGAR